MNYKRMNKAHLIEEIGRLNQQLASKVQGLTLYQNLLDSLKEKEEITQRLIGHLTQKVEEYETNKELYPVISDREAAILLFFRLTGVRQMAHSLEMVLDMATLYTNLPIDTTEKDLLLPLKELKDSLSSEFLLN